MSGKIVMFGGKVEITRLKSACRNLQLREENKKISGGSQAFIRGFAEILPLLRRFNSPPIGWVEIKKAKTISFGFRAEGGIRTPTGLRPLRPERSASTSSTTSAGAQS